VTNPGTGASTIVIISDRGPDARGRDIDRPRGAVRAIGIVDIGLVCVEIL
jgi:rare lipoprotein A (peptidoglycan hydrolase)